MNKTYINRLLTLACHLDNDENHTNPFLNYVQEIGEEKTLMACVFMMREIADLFVDDFRITPEGAAPAHYEKMTLAHLASFFGLTMSEAKHVFVIGGQDIQQFGGRRLVGIWAPQDLADNIFQLIKKRGWVNENLIK